VKIGVLGGTFDPIHNGHIALAVAARDAHRLDRVLFVPAGSPPHKRTAVRTPAQERLAMVRIALEGLDGFEVCTLEVERSGPSYTVDTLEELRRQHPTAELFLLVGADAFAELGTWREARRVFDLARVVVVDRPDAARAGTLSLPSLPARALEKCERDRVEMAPVPISSTEVRHRAARGEDIASLVPEGVARYIRERGLYASSSA
jgi:nicotinate-nucleotide adenylyltransferase